MMQGTFVFDDHSIRFCTSKNGRIEYVVHDAFSGISATRNVAIAEFSAALYIAMNGTGEVGEGMYTLAAAAMPRVPADIRSGEELAKEDAERAARYLRWIP